MAERTAVVDAPRPETREAEDAHFLRAYRAELERIADILRLPGSPDLTRDLAPAVRNLAMENARLRGG